MKCKLYIFLLFNFFLIQFLNGQVLEVELSENTINANNNELVNFHAKVTNNSNETQQFKLQFNIEASEISVVSSIKEAYTLAPLASIFIPIKAIVSKNAQAEKSIPIVLEFKDFETSSVITLERLEVLIQEKRDVRFSVDKSTLIIKEVGDTLSFHVRLLNNGNSKQKLSVLTRFYEGSVNKLTRKEAELEPFKDTILDYKFIVNADIFKDDDFKIGIKVLYSNGNIFGTENIQVNSLKHVRTYKRKVKNQDLQNSSLNNAVSLTTQKTGENYQHLFYANNQFEFKKGTLQSNLDVNWWQTNDLLLIRNTWLKYDAENYGVKLGNLFYSNIINSTGRGAEGYYRLTKNKKISLGGLNKSPNLINQQLDYTFGNLIWFNYIDEDKEESQLLEAGVVYDEDPLMNYKSYLASGSSTVIVSDSLNLRLGGSVSQTSLYDNADEQKFGGSAEALLNITKGNFRFDSNNFYSTGHYAGLRRGALSLNEKITYMTSNYNFWGFFNYLSFEPKTLSEEMRSNSFNTNLFGLGISKPLKKFNISLSPKYSIENRKGLGSEESNEEEFFMKSSRVGLNVSYNDITTQQYLSFNFEGGFYKTNFFDGTKENYKINLTYNWRFFNLNSYYQHNSFFLGEEFFASQSQAGDTYQFNIVPSLESYFFNKKLKTFAGASYSMNSNAQENIQANTRLDYLLSNKFQLFCTAFISDFSSTFLESSTIQVGVIGRLQKFNLHEKKYNLKLKIYYNQKSGTENLKTPASNEILIINKKAFVTNSNGEVSYKSLPEGDYHVEFLNSKKWYAEDLNIDLKEDTEIEVFMKETISVVGSVTYQKTSLSYVVSKNIDALTIKLVDKEGNEFKSKTDLSGNFRIFVPPGIYKMYLQSRHDSSKVEIVGQGDEITVDNSKKNQVQFIFKVKERKVERKKFKSSSF